MSFVTERNQNCFFDTLSCFVVEFHARREEEKWQRWFFSSSSPSWGWEGTFTAHLAPTHKSPLRLRLLPAKPSEACIARGGNSPSSSLLTPTNRRRYMQFAVLLPEEQPTPQLLVIHRGKAKKPFLTVARSSFLNGNGLVYSAG